MRESVCVWEREGDDGSLGVGVDECHSTLITRESVCAPIVGKF